MVDKLVEMHQQKDNEYISTSHIGDSVDCLEKDMTLSQFFSRGSIVNGESGNSFMGGTFIGDHTLQKQLNKMLEDDSVKALVLRVNSPGRAVLVIPLEWVATHSRLGRPIAYLWWLCCFWRMLHLDGGRLYRNTGMTGSKLSLEKVKFGRIVRKNGMKYTYKRGEQSNIFSSTGNFSDSERRKYQEFLDGFYKYLLKKQHRVGIWLMMIYIRLHRDAYGQENKPWKKLGWWTGWTWRSSAKAKIGGTRENGTCVFFQRKNSIGNHFGRFK